MPEKDGKLTDEELTKAVEIFRKWEVEKLGGDLICEVCKNNYWVPHHFLLSRDSDHPDHSGITWRLPSVAFVCTDCGNTKSFYAPKMGITPHNPSKEDKEGGENGS